MIHPWKSLEYFGEPVSFFLCTVIKKAVKQINPQPFTDEFKAISYFCTLIFDYLQEQ